MDELRRFLERLPPGSITDTRELESLPSQCWDAFEGHDQEKMSAYKLHDRMENVLWDPPVLEFSIERHGGTVLGSTYADVQYWRLDTEAMKAHVLEGGRRQVKQRQNSLDCTTIAEEIANLILEGRADQRVTRMEDGSVRVLVRHILQEGSACRETLQNRRRRFRDALRRAMSERQWTEKRLYVFAPPSAGPRNS